MRRLIRILLVSTSLSSEVVINALPTSPFDLFGASVSQFVKVGSDSCSECTHPICTALSSYQDESFFSDERTNIGLRELRSAFESINYSTGAVVAKLNIKPFEGFQADELALCDTSGETSRLLSSEALAKPKHFCPPLPDPLSASPLDVVIQLFIRFNIGYDKLGSIGVPRGVAERAIGATAVNVLIDLGVLIENAAGEVFSLLQIVPIDESIYIATDFYLVSGSKWASQMDAVMSLGPDTAAMVYGAPRNRESQRLLDLCAGSGVQGIVAMSHYAEDVTLVDINERAIRFSRFNGALNEMPRDRFRVFRGNLYAALPLETKQFDTILANPPYRAEKNGLWTTTQESLFGAGGTLGLEVTREIVIGAGRWLSASKNGNEALRIVATIYNHDFYGDWLKEWVGEWQLQPKYMSFFAWFKSWWAGQESIRSAVSTQNGPAVETGLLINLFTGEVWSKDYIKLRKFAGHDIPSINTGGNALIWIKRSSSEDLNEVKFERKKLHSFLWESLRSETGLRPLMQYLLRRKGEVNNERNVDGDQPNYYTASIKNRKVSAFPAAWGQCAIIHFDKSAIEDMLATRKPGLQLLPANISPEQEERMLECVDQLLVR